MRWLVEFYNERRGILARYGVEASLPAAAVLFRPECGSRGASIGATAKEAELARAGRARRWSGRQRLGPLLEREGRWVRINSRCPLETQSENKARP